MNSLPLEDMNMILKVIMEHILLIEHLSMVKCEKDITSLLMHWSYIFLALTHQFFKHVFKFSLDTDIRLVYSSR